MPLKTKSILAPKEQNDGLRISIMSRHTLSDGTTPDPRITEDLFNRTMKELAPPPKLIGAYYKNGMTWSEFSARFDEHLARPITQMWLEHLIRMARAGDVTIMCIEDTPEHCHRRLVAEACSKIDPTLEIIIK
ncbi:MAG: DUF488 domain-containing protein [Patescibacteria group bacterium]